jgi:glycerate 2-kinase
MQKKEEPAHPVIWIKPQKLLEDCFAAMVRAVDPGTLVRQALQRQGRFLYLRGEPIIDLAQASRVWLAGLGKASLAMVNAAQAILGDYLYRGLVISPVPAECVPPLQGVVGSHPLPDERSLAAGEQLFAMVSGLQREDLLLFFLSGGGSSLAVLPVEGITLAEKQAAMEVLLRSPLSIAQVNAVRKRLSRLKGGGLARAAFPATVWNFVLSDVAGDDLGTVASGPFQPAGESAKELHTLLVNERLLDHLPDVVNRVLMRPFPSEDTAAGFSWVHNILLGGNRMALQEGKDFFERAGVPCTILSDSMEGEVKVLADRHARIVREALGSGHPISVPTAVRGRVFSPGTRLRQRRAEPGICSLLCPSHGGLSRPLAASFRRHRRDRRTHRRCRSDHRPVQLGSRPGSGSFLPSISGRQR